MNLAKVQLFSLATKAVTTALGILQSVIVVRILSPAEFGLVGLVVSIGSVIGVSQHLGIVDGAIREIAVRKKKEEIGKVFWVSHLARQAVTIPLSLALAMFAEPIAVGIYSRPEIVPYILIFAGVLVFQGLQDVLGATMTGLKKFGALYAIQIITAAINVGVFGYLTWKFGVYGFFWAIVLTTAIMTALLGFSAMRELKGYLALPSWQDIKLYGKTVMHIGAFMYVARIFFVVWQRLPILLLGGVLTAEELGYINISLTFGSKLTVIAMALSEVNLAWMSSLFVQKRDEFTREVTRNMHRVLVLMLLMTLVLLFFAPEIIQYIIGAQYVPAEPLILLVTTAFFLYALTDIGTSSVFVPANDPKMRAYIYGAFTLVTGAITAWLLLTAPNALGACAAMALGALCSYVLMVVIARRRFGIVMISAQLAMLIAALFVSVAWLFTNPSLSYRIIFFSLLSAYALWEAHRSKLIPDWRKLYENTPQKVGDTKHISIICFAGAEYPLPFWTNRQHIMSFISQRHRVLYVEPRVWLSRHILKHFLRPEYVARYLWRLIWHEKKSPNLYIVSQWNAIPWSRESKIISAINHALNRWCVLLKAKRLGFLEGTQVVWIYDTEAAEYLSAFPKATVVYDCVDDHAAQAGVNRNPARVAQEETAILSRANLVTTTSHKLYELKKERNPNTHLALNAGDVELYLAGPSLEASEKANEVMKHISSPIIGTVGALDSYKIDFELLADVARRKLAWQFVFIGSPVVERMSKELSQLLTLPNVHVLGTINRRDVPAYVHKFDVCMIPYRDSRYNEASFPLKFWEFMAAGKSIVASGAPELRNYESLISYISTSDQFIEAVDIQLQSSNIHSAERQEMAREHSWQRRAEKLLSLLYETIGAK